MLLIFLVTMLGSCFFNSDCQMGYRYIRYEIMTCPFFGLEKVGTPHYSHDRF